MLTARVRIVLVAAIAVEAGGCVVPATITRMPELTGRVVHADGRPAAGWPVTLTSGPSTRPADQRLRRLPATPKFRQVLVTGADGRFRRPEQRYWIVWLVPGNSPGVPAHVRADAGGGVTADGTAEAEAGRHPFNVGPLAAADDGRVDLGTLVLPVATSRPATIP